MFSLQAVLFLEREKSQSNFLVEILHSAFAQMLLLQFHPKDTITRTTVLEFTIVFLVTCYYDFYGVIYKLRHLLFSEGMGL